MSLFAVMNGEMSDSATGAQGHALQQHYLEAQYIQLYSYSAEESCPDSSSISLEMASFSA